MLIILSLIKFVLIIVALGYAAYSWVYMKDAAKTERYIGIIVPPTIKNVIKIDILISLMVACFSLLLLIFNIS